MLGNIDVLLTIIVPAYNVEKYVGDCLESLINQTKNNHKVIIINDGSTDMTEKICQNYQNKYPDLITYVYQDNQGLGDARNSGLKMVESPYVCFLDSDDWLNTKYVECFSNLIDDVDELPDLIFTLPWVYDTITKRVSPWKDKERYDRIFAVKDGISQVQINSRQCPELYALEVNACRKIYKTEFLKQNNFSFPMHLKWEDVPGHFYLLHQANTCMALPQIGFFYRVNQGGQITAGGGASRLDLIPIFEQLLDVARNYEFNKTEMAYVLRLIADFSKWSIDVTNMDFIRPLLDGVHKIFQTFTKDEVDYYLNTLSTNRETEAGFISCLAGDRYWELEDYENREQIIESCYKSTLPQPVQAIEKKNLIQGGIQCICEHGISYTAIWMVRKYLLRKK